MTGSLLVPNCFHSLLCSNAAQKTRSNGSCDERATSTTSCRQARSDVSWRSNSLTFYRETGRWRTDWYRCLTSASSRFSTSISFSALDFVNRADLVLPSFHEIRQKTNQFSFKKAVANFLSKAVTGVKGQKEGGFDSFLVSQIHSPARQAHYHRQMPW